MHHDPKVIVVLTIQQADALQWELDTRSDIAPASPLAGAREALDDGLDDRNLCNRHHGPAGGLHDWPDTCISCREAAKPLALSRPAE